MATLFHYQLNYNPNLNRFLFKVGPATGKKLSMYLSEEQVEELIGMMTQKIEALAVGVGVGVGVGVALRRRCVGWQFKQPPNWRKN